MHTPAYNPCARQTQISGGNSGGRAQQNFHRTQYGEGLGIDALERVYPSHVWLRIR
jgi:hypothetical protein